MFKTGDKVKVLDDNQVGVVVRVHQNRITVLNDYGFEETYDSSELILIEELPIADFEQFPEEIPQAKNSSKISDEPKEIDLHIGQLRDYTAGLSNYEMLQIQLDKVKSEIESARKEKRRRLIFIHGHGSGKLREELHKLLNSYARLEFYDASFWKYKLGATEVKLY